MKIYVPDIYFCCKKCNKLFRRDYDFIIAVKNDTAVITCSCGNEFKIELVKWEELNNC